jgi:hypothetical protein
MANDTSGTLSVSSNDVPVLNDRFRKIRDELDTRMGLKGPINHYDSLRYLDSNQQLLHCLGDSGLTS